MYHVGERFGRLTVSRFHHKEGRCVFVVCRCDCGRVKVIRVTNLLGGQKSCGCASKEYFDRGNKVKDKKLYAVYRAMKLRCNNSNMKCYNNYGGRGIKVCPAWNQKHGYWAFETWAFANGYQHGLTLDRIDNNLGYCPENCRWVSMRIQQNNKRTNRLFEFNGRTYTISELARLAGLTHAGMSRRLKVGWAIEDAIKPKRKNHEISLPRI